MRVRSLAITGCFIASCLSCTTPLHAQVGGLVSSNGAHPAAEVGLNMERAIWTSVPSHQAVWIGGALSLEAAPFSLEELVGPEIKYSRVTDVRSRNPIVTVLYIRPELGIARQRKAMSEELTFVGGSAGVIRTFGAIPFMFSIRVGRDMGVEHPGFTASAMVGVVVGTGLYWIQ